jgi:hypothetical protein
MQKLDPGNAAQGIQVDGIGGDPSQWTPDNAEYNSDYSLPVMRSMSRISKLCAATRGQDLGTLQLTSSGDRTRATGVEISPP